MRVIFYIPPLRSMSGGLANIYTVAEMLRELGRDVALMGPASDAVGFSATRLPVLPWDTPLLPEDIWCIPESWPQSLLPGLRAKCRVLVYVQNWIYAVRTLPDGVRWGSLPLEFIAVSRPLKAFLEQVLQVPVLGIVPASVPENFYTRGKRPRDRVRIALMPRKNRALGEQIQQVAKACLAEAPDSPRLEWVVIHNLTRDQVAETLASCHIFLSTGFPEGFGLPPLEAMACGCVPIGCAGFGGWEYMRQASLPGLVSSYAPQFPVLEFPDDTEGNGFFFADADTLGTGIALAKAIQLAHGNGPEWQALMRRCRETALRYTQARQRETVDVVFPG